MQCLYNEGEHGIHFWHPLDHTEQTLMVLFSVFDTGKDELVL